MMRLHHLMSRRQKRAPPATPDFPELEFLAGHILAPGGIASSQLRICADTLHSVLQLRRRYPMLSGAGARNAGSRRGSVSMRGDDDLVQRQRTIAQSHEILNLPVAALRQNAAIFIARASGTLPRCRYEFHH